MGVWLAVRGFIAFVPAVVWKYIAIGVVMVCLFVAGDLRGSRVANEKCAAAAALAQKAADAQDLQAEKEGRAQDLQITNSLTEQKKVDDAELAKLKTAVTARPAGTACVYDKTNGDPDPAGDKPAPRGVRKFIGGPKKGASNPKHP